MSDNHLEELVPILTRRRRVALGAALAIVLVALPTMAVAGVTRPSLDVELVGGQWDQATGLGEIVLEVHNHGIVGVTVESAAVPGTALTLQAPITVDARSRARVALAYEMQCSGEMFDEVSVDADEPTELTLRVALIWPVADDFTVDQGTSFLPTRGMCTP